MSASLVGETIGVLGLARSGLAAAKLALARGARVYASDMGDNPQTRRAAEQINAMGGLAETGRHDLGKLARCNRIVLSPGIPPTAAVLRAPEIAHVPVIPEIEFAFGLLECPVIAITGTNGKTTVTSLIGHLLHEHGQDAAVGGNIGTALSELVMREPQPRVAVVETSSFQLGGIREFNPRIGVLTNLAPDHLDWYSSVDAYYADKAHLFRNATGESRWVLNGEDPKARDLPGSAPGTRYYFRVASQPAAGELGGFLSPDGWLTLRLEAGREERIVTAGELRILGQHNIANALAASIAARLAGASPEAIARGLRSFEAPPHRLQPIAETDGVLWINDSKATNIASTQVAVRGMTRPTVLLLGGRHKGEPYTELLPELEMGKVKRILAFGEAGPVIEHDLAGKFASVERVDGDFDDVVRRAREVARPGDAVLLSPACSSFDMFVNYEERGKRFAELVTGRAAPEPALEAA
ncbi:UDP-N-acetylmuramoyl-L-alanine--D-glutamate ligase [Longimicrobium sp.]|uniref:UDP-N-acetylmuramoyl-L-alanine--D-glutamate ligase n=1 Tax=Longimicrobium sp. TaxID=2029185 RepID=UPI002B6E7803|nr:UDP-N-acetylmuramoyl-L-alanine--D-glutamate ligase [Longimicrobium sp.]HSU15192.1 UDP-N-acetylmuramoyl-L-alanine--D-glutamate ligase [Longimicrobium sp.]